MSFSLADRIDAVYRSDAFWVAMLEDSNFKAGPFDGGCLTCALAIIRAHGNGELVRITNTSSNTTHHYGAFIMGCIYDFDGIHESPIVWISEFRKNEALYDQPLGFDLGFDEYSRIPMDAYLEGIVAELLLNDELIVDIRSHNL